MKRRVISMKLLAEGVPQLEAYRHELITSQSMEHVLSLIDIWAKANGLRFVQVFSTPGAGTFFIFNISRFSRFRNWWSDKMYDLFVWTAKD